MSRSRRIQEFAASADYRRLAADPPARPSRRRLFAGRIVVTTVFLLLAVGWLLGLLAIVFDEWPRAAGWLGPAFGALIAGLIGASFGIKAWFLLRELAQEWPRYPRASVAGVPVMVTRAERRGRGIVIELTRPDGSTLYPELCGTRRPELASGDIGVAFLFGEFGLVEFRRAPP